MGSMHTRLAELAVLAGLAWTAPQFVLAAPGQDARIARIEHDLRPVLQVRGRAVEAHTLAEEMAIHHTPSVSIAVVDHGRILWARAYGLADVAGKTPATTRTLYQAGSISKPVTASATLQMVQEGRLKLDAPVNDQLKSWRIPDSPFTQGRPVTLRHLLTHTGGLTVSGFGGYAAGAPVPTVVQVLEGRPPANTGPVVVDQQPGTAWRYSGGGMVVAQLLMTDVEGRSFPDLMRRRVLSRSGMADSTFEQPLPPARSAGAATGYLPDGKPVEGRFHTYPEMAAAGLWTTPSDLARWAIALERAYNGEPSPLMSQASARAMLTRGLGGWGLGIAVDGAGDGLRFGHGGGDAGFRANLAGWPAGERAIVVMADSDDGFAVIQPLVQAVAREYGWKGLEPQVVDAVALTDEQRAQIVGSWGHGVLVVSSEEGRLVVRAMGRTMELIPQAGDRFILDADGEPTPPVTAIRGADGKVRTLDMGPDGRWDRDN